MKRDRDHMNLWERQASELLTPLAESPPNPEPNLPDKVIGRVYISISAGDLIELNTLTLVNEYLRSIVGVFGFLFFEAVRGKYYDDKPI